MRTTDLWEDLKKESLNYHLELLTFGNNFVIAKTNLDRFACRSDEPNVASL